jgi:peptidoglycan hydrolase CwlO-like protein
MNYRKLISNLALPSIVVGTMIIASSCRPMVTPQQLEELKELRAKEKSLTEQIQAQKDDISKIKPEISSRESELKDCTEKSDFVKQKLAQWPNIWPDWPPEPPAAPVVPEKKKKK